MKKTSTLLLTLGVSAMLMASCSSSKDSQPTGTWTSQTPIVVTQAIDGARQASKVLTFDFSAPEAGKVTYTADYTVTAPFVTDSVSGSSQYQVKASVEGTYAAKAGEDDDYLLTFDTNTLSVQGTNAPELGPVTDDFLQSLTALAKIEDVEVSKDGSRMSFETDSPDVEYHFVKK